MLGDQDTIAAISSAKGIGALSIVRISGPETKKIVSQAFSAIPQKWETHRAYHGYWLDPLTKKQLDEVLVLYFSQGKGFTGEEAAEVICHGGTETTSSVLSVCLSSGARLARPGEFTYRAVMNGKLDLAQAESVLEIIQARTPQAAAMALKNIQGALSEKLLHFEKEIIFLLAHLEASIDFTTEDIQPVSYKEMLKKVGPVIESAQDLLKTYLPSQVSKLGLRTILAGKPNGGKSSLFNAVLGFSRSIVDENPGTTRDTIEAEIKLSGQLFCLVDTAGLRSTENRVEGQGVLRTQEELNSGDLVVIVVDGTVGLGNVDAEQIRSLGASRTIICFNKNDMSSKDMNAELSRFGLTEFKSVSTNTLNQQGIKPLVEILCEIGQKRALGSEVDSAISTQRQKENLELACCALVETKSALEGDASPDLVSLSLREALGAVQSTLGKNVGDDVMDRVFKEFCIGK